MTPPGPGVSGRGYSEMNTTDDFHKTLLDNLYDGVYFVDRDRRITYWNKGAERITGYAAQEVEGKRCADSILMHVDDKGNVLCTGCLPALRSNAGRRAEKHRCLPSP